MQILYCDSCGFRIDEEDVEKSQVGGKVICVKCRATAERAASGVGARKSSAKIVAIGHSSKRTDPVRKTDPSAHAHRSTGAPASGAKLMPAIVILVLLGGGAAFLLLTKSEKPKPQAAAPKTPPKPEAEIPKVARPDPQPRKTPKPLEAPKETPERVAAPDKKPSEVVNFEKQAEDEYARVSRFEGLAPDDDEGRIKRLKEFLDKYNDATVASRARIDLEKRLHPLPKVPPLNVSSDPAPASLAEGLLAYWTFDAENGGKIAADLPKALEGEMRGVTLSDDVAPLPGTNARSLAFAGTVGEQLAIDTKYADTTNSFSVSAWVFPSAERNETQEDKDGVSGTSAQRYAIFPTQGGQTYGPKHATAGLSVGTNGVSIFEHSDGYMPSVLVLPVAVKGWVHVTMVYDNHQPKLYLNGKLMKTGQISDHTVHPPHQIGDAGNYGPYAGKVDEVRIYSRVLTEAEIRALSAAKAPEKK